jgi:cytoskeletal protein RodZ
MHNWEPRERGMRLLRRLTTGIAVAGVAGVGIFAAIGAATIPGNAQAQKAPDTSAASSSAASSSESDDSSSQGTVAAPAATPQPASTGPVHAVTGAS